MKYEELNRVAYTPSPHSKIPESIFSTDWARGRQQRVKHARSTAASVLTDQQSNCRIVPIVSHYYYTV